LNQNREFGKKTSPKKNIDESQKDVVLFVSREHGLRVLNGILISRKYNVIQVFTHALIPKSQDPYNTIRDDYHSFMGTCYNESITFFQVDSKDKPLDVLACDFIIETSWRYLIPKSITSKAKILAFGIHRGKLPDYAGERPIKQALEKGDKEIILSAHDLSSSEIDMGKVLLTEKYKIKKRNEDYIRDDIAPLFPKLALRVLDKFTK
jgi:methionyl-tRNA formyltransferase